MKIKTFCVILTMLFALPLCCKADILLPLISPITQDPDPIENPRDKKHKAPPAPVLCFIDFETETVSFSSLSIGEVEEYLIYDETGETCIADYDNAIEFVVALGNLSGEYCIRFLTINGYYTGYINL